VFAKEIFVEEEFAVHDAWRSFEDLEDSVGEDGCLS
jgi:hypothetical protein